MFTLKSKIVSELLGYYFLNTKARHYINELARKLDLDPGNLDRKLKELEKEGIFISEKMGKQKYYFLNKNYPFLAEVKKVFESKYGLKQKLSLSLKNLKDLKEAYIFGSYASDSLQQSSDIDILLIGDHSAMEAGRILHKFEKKYYREFNSVDMTDAEFQSRKKNKDELLERIFGNEYIKLI